MEKRVIVRRLHDAREDDLRECRRADFEHLRDEDRVYIGSEILIFVSIVHLDPATACPWPGDFFGYTLHRNSGYVTDDIREASDRRSIENDILVDLVEYEKTSILTCYAYDFDEVFSWVDDSCRIIGIDDEDTSYILVVPHFALEFLEIDTTTLHDIQRVGDRLTIMVHRLSCRMRWIGRIGPDDADMRREIGEDLIDRFTESVKKYDILYCTDSTIRVVVEDEFSSSEISLGRGVGIGPIMITGIFHDLFHPCGDTLTLRDGVADILPDHFFDPAFFYLFTDLDDLTDLVLQVFFTLFYEVFSHGGSIAKSVKKAKKL